MDTHKTQWVPETGTSRSGTDPQAKMSALGPWTRDTHEPETWRALTPDSVALLRHLNRGACVVFGIAAIGAEWTLRRETLWLATSFKIGDNQATRKTTRTKRQATEHRKLHSPFRQGAHWMTAQPHDRPVRGITVRDSDAELLGELCRALAMAIPRCVVSRYATAWAEIPEGAHTGHRSWAILWCCRCRILLPEIPKGCGRSEELKRRVPMWEAGELQYFVGRILGQRHTGQQNKEKKDYHPRQNTNKPM